MNSVDLAQVNVARMRAPLEDPLMADFVAQLESINALADASTGFIWRLQSEAGDATYLQPYEDDRILFNLSVWQTLEDLRRFVYRSAHADVLRRRQAWFERFDGPYSALWWVPESHIPSVDEAKKRLEHLRSNGPTSFAFTFNSTFSPSDHLIRTMDWSASEPCTST